MGAAAENEAELLRAITCELATTCNSCGIPASKLGNLLGLKGHILPRRKGWLARILRGRPEVFHVYQIVAANPGDMLMVRLRTEYVPTRPFALFPVPPSWIDAERNIHYADFCKLG